MRLEIGEDRWAFTGLSELEWLFLERLPGMAEGSGLDPSALKRLYPDPLAGRDRSEEAEDSGTEGEFLDDWRELVRPELEGSFRLAREGVGRDLEAVERVAGPSGELRRRLAVGADRAEIWYSTLNQARLLMNEVYRIADAEQRLSEVMGAEDGEQEGGMLWLLLAQYQFYTYVQSFLLERYMQP